MQVVAVQADGTVSFVGTIRRGTALEAISLQGGGVALARYGAGRGRAGVPRSQGQGGLLRGPCPKTRQGTSCGATTTRSRAPRAPACRATGRDSVVLWRNGQTVHVDLLAGATSSLSEAWTMDLPVLFGKGSDGTTTSSRIDGRIGPSVSTLSRSFSSRAS